MDFSTILGLAAEGGSRILAGLSTWQSRTEEEMIRTPAVVGFEVAAGQLDPASTPLVGSHESSTGPLALADYDGDGDLDLFVGSRAIPMRYPVATSSGLFRNQAGRFELDQANSEALRGVGLVSAAVFADLDGDGDPDLALARDWGSILLLVNDGGRFVAGSEAAGLSPWTSRWRGLAAGDLDGDGRLDLVATSWGRNVAARADSAHPLLLVHGPFGAAGEEEMFLARHDPRLGAPAPLISYARLRVAVPSVVGRVRTFAGYADATTDRVLGPATSSAGRLQARTLDHMAFINRGGRFEAVPLPMEAQLAPASYAGIADFTGDGIEDLFLAQNFYPTAVGVPRYDAGRGLLLRGTGRLLQPLPAAQSGLLVYGDQRGAAYSDLDADGRLDLVVSQNGQLTRLFRNRGAVPGLRVRLLGPAENPDAIGAQIRIIYGERMGPVREVQAGSGYWSQNGAVQVFGLSSQPSGVWVRWPGGDVVRLAVEPGAREVVVRR
jgi:hypothetical protein